MRLHQLTERALDGDRTAADLTLDARRQSYWGFTDT
jgi:hypothetical protein